MPSQTPSCLRTPLQLQTTVEERSVPTQPQFDRWKVRVVVRCVPLRHGSVEFSSALVSQVTALVETSVRGWHLPLIKSKRRVRCSNWFDSMLQTSCSVRDSGQRHTCFCTDIIFLHLQSLGSNRMLMIFCVFVVLLHGVIFVMVWLHSIIFGVTEVEAMQFAVSSSDGL